MQSPDLDETTLMLCSSLGWQCKPHTDPHLLILTTGRTYSDGAPVTLLAGTACDDTFFASDNQETKRRLAQAWRADGNRTFVNLDILIRRNQVKSNGFQVFVDSVRPEDAAAAFGRLTDTLVEADTMIRLAAGRGESDTEKVAR